MFKIFCGMMTVAFAIKITIANYNGKAEVNDTIYFALYFILMVMLVGFDEIKELIKNNKEVK